jgi:hypothetical protein
MRHLWIFTLTLLTYSSSSWGYYALLDNAEILKRGQYKVTPDLQILTDDGGANVGVRMDIGFEEDYGLRALAGAGDTDFFLGGVFRWVPIPDIESQPAMALNIGIIYGKDEDVRDLTFRTEPMLAKKIEIETTTWTPYVGLPAGLRIRQSDDPLIDEDTELTFQLIVGSQFKFEQIANWQFLGEFGADLDNSPTYIAVAAAYYFDAGSSDTPPSTAAMNLR